MPVTSFNLYISIVCVSELGIWYLCLSIVILDEKVTWSNQIDDLSKRLTSAAGIFSKLRYYLDIKTMIQMYHSLFNSKLQYGILCWGSAVSSKISKLQILQNKAIRYMNKAPRYFRLDNYYLNQRILKVDDLYNLEVSKFMHSHFQGTLPICFCSFFIESRFLHNYRTRSTVNGPYRASNFKTNWGKRSIQYHGPIFWNRLPNDIKSVSSKLSFKKMTKNWLFSQYWYLLIALIFLFSFGNVIIFEFTFQHNQHIRLSIVFTYQSNSIYIFFLSAYTPVAGGVGGGWLEDSQVRFRRRGWFSFRKVRWWLVSPLTSLY